MTPMQFQLRYLAGSDDAADVARGRTLLSKRGEHLEWIGACAQGRADRQILQLAGDTKKRPAGAWPRCRLRAGRLGWPSLAYDARDIDKGCLARCIERPVARSHSCPW